VQSALSEQRLIEPFMSDERSAGERAERGRVAGSRFGMIVVLMPGVREMVTRV
jgi:hypothetical protein